MSVRSWLLSGPIANPAVRNLDARGKAVDPPLAAADGADASIISFEEHFSRVLQAFIPRFAHQIGARPPQPRHAGAKALLALIWLIFLLTAYDRTFIAVGQKRLTCHSF
jgi:hypothetical protein